MKRILEILWTLALLLAGTVMVILTIDANRGLFR